MKVMSVPPCPSLAAVNSLAVYWPSSWMLAVWTPSGPADAADRGVEPIAVIRRPKTALRSIHLSAAAGALGRAKRTRRHPDLIRNPTDQPQALSSC